MSAAAAAACAKDYEFTDHVSKHDYVKICAVFERYDNLSLKLIDTVITEYDADLANEKKCIEKEREKCALEIGLIEKGRRKKDTSAEFAAKACERIESLQNALKESEAASEKKIEKIVADLEQMHKIRSTFIDLYPNAILSPRSSQSELVETKGKNSLRLSATRLLQRGSSQNSLASSPRRLRTDEQEEK